MPKKSKKFKKSIYRKPHWDVHFSRPDSQGKTCKIVFPPDEKNVFWHEKVFPKNEKIV